MKISRLFCALTLFALMPLSNVAFALSCPGANVSAMGTFARVTGAMGSAASFIGTGCTGAAMGGTMAPVFCDIFGTRGGPHSFLARWLNTANRTAAGTTAGCSFTCEGGSCFVRASDGLPVELMQFGVEEQDPKK